MAAAASGPAAGSARRRCAGRSGYRGLLQRHARARPARDRGRARPPEEPHGARHGRAELLRRGAPRRARSRRAGKAPQPAENPGFVVCEESSRFSEGWDGSRPRRRGRSVRGRTRVEVRKRSAAPVPGVRGREPRAHADRSRRLGRAQSRPGGHPDPFDDRVGRRIEPRGTGGRRARLHRRDRGRDGVGGEDAHHSPATRPSFSAIRAAAASARSLPRTRTRRCGAPR